VIAIHAACQKFVSSKTDRLLFNFSFSSTLKNVRVPLGRFIDFKSAFIYCNLYLCFLAFVNDVTFYLGVYMKYGKDCNASGLYLRHKKVIPFSGGVCCSNACRTIGIS
jgi:hypothetical protein